MKTQETPGKPLEKTMLETVVYLTLHLYDDKKQVENEVRPEEID